MNALLERTSDSVEEIASEFYAAKDHDEEPMATPPQDRSFVANNLHVTLDPGTIIALGFASGDLPTNAELAKAWDACKRPIALLGVLHDLGRSKDSVHRFYATWCVFYTPLAGEYWPSHVLQKANVDPCLFRMAEFAAAGQIEKKWLGYAAYRVGNAVCRFVEKRDDSVFGHAGLSRMFRYASDRAILEAAASACDPLDGPISDADDEVLAYGGYFKFEDSHTMAWNVVSRMLKAAYWSGAASSKKGCNRNGKAARKHAAAALADGLRKFYPNPFIVPAG